MSISDLIFAIDQEIDRLQRAKSLLTGTSATKPRVYKKRGPKSWTPEMRAQLSKTMKAKWAAKRKKL